MKRWLRIACAVVASSVPLAFLVVLWAAGTGRLVRISEVSALFVIVIIGSIGGVLLLEPPVSRDGDQ